MNRSSDRERMILLVEDTDGGSSDLARALGETGEVVRVSSLEEAVLRSEGRQPRKLRPGDLALIMSNGDFDHLLPRLCAALGEGR